MESRKIVLMYQFTGKKWRCKWREWTCGHSGARSKTNWGSSTDIYTLSCVKHIASGKLLYNTGSPAWCSVMTWRGGMGEGKEAQEGEDTHTHTHTYIYIKLWLICIVVRQKPTQHCKAIILQFKKQTRSYCIAQRTLSISYDKPQWKRIWKRISICATESLRCTAVIITRL